MALGRLPSEGSFSTLDVSEDAKWVAWLTIEDDGQKLHTARWESPHGFVEPRVVTLPCGRRFVDALEVNGPKVTFECDYAGFGEVMLADIEKGTVRQLTRRHLTTDASFPSAFHRKPRFLSANEPVYLDEGALPNGAGEPKCHFVRYVIGASSTARSYSSARVPCDVQFDVSGGRIFYVVPSTQEEPDVSSARFDVMEVPQNGDAPRVRCALSVDYESGDDERACRVERVKASTRQQSVAVQFSCAESGSGPILLCRPDTGEYKSSANDGAEVRMVDVDDDGKIITHNGSLSRVEAITRLHALPYFVDKVDPHDVSGFAEWQRAATRLREQDQGEQDQEK